MYFPIIILNNEWPNQPPLSLSTASIEQMTVLDRISADTLIFLQLHKRVWPTAQRDALFWSHIRKIPPTDPANGDAYDTWIVCNQSTEHPDAPVSGQVGQVGV